MTASIDPQLLERIRSARALPSPPAVTARLIELGENPNVGLDKILDVLQTDAALCARLLRLANSPLYARRRRTENLRQAVTLLGVDAVLTAALSLTLLSDTGPASMSPRFRRDRWARSVHAAVCAQTLAQHSSLASPGDAFLAALLQDIGVQVVLRLEPETYATTPEDCHHGDLIVAELAALGADHALIGAELLEAWRLPERIVAAVRASHDADLLPDADPLLRLVPIAGLMADGMNGDTAALQQASTLAADLLGLNEELFRHAFDAAVETLPDLASILQADPPDPTIVAEMAQDVLVGRLMSTQTTAIELSEQLTMMTSVAASLQAENQLDPLTKLSNRRHLDVVLYREFRLAIEHGFPLSVLFIDLDSFKQVNDRYGHGVGDDVLIRSARRISTCVRDGDVVGRYGGEEFVVVLPGAGITASCSAADRLIHRFESKDFDLGSDLVLRQTVSIGVATLDDPVTCDDVDQLVHAADLALYEAKRSGKNRWRRTDVSNRADAPVAASAPVRGRV